jgi:hypothetical protein
MTEEHLRELINRDVDGDLSPSERRTLERAMRRNAPARRLHAEIKSVETLLSSLRQVEPPANLATRIRADIRSRVTPARSRQTWIASLGTILQTPTMVRYGTVFAGGLVTGAFLFLLLVHPQPSPVVSGDAATGSLLTHSEVYNVELQGAKGTLTAVQTERGKDMTLSLACGSPTTTKLTYDPSRVKLENVHEVQAAGGPVIVSDGVIQMTGTGSQRWSLSFTGVKDSRITVQVTSAGGGTFNRDIQVR